MSEETENAGTARVDAEDTAAAAETTVPDTLSTPPPRSGRPKSNVGLYLETSTRQDGKVTRRCVFCGREKIGDQVQATRWKKHILEDCAVVDDADVMLKEQLEQAKKSLSRLSGKRSPGDGQLTPSSSNKKLRQTSMHDTADSCDAERAETMERLQLITQLRAEIDWIIQAPIYNNLERAQHLAPLKRQLDALYSQMQHLRKKPTTAPVDPTTAPVEPTVAPGAEPTGTPVEPTTAAPGADPTEAPLSTTPPIATGSPADPTKAPGADPSEAPVTEAPGATPTEAPVEPTVAPGAGPTEAPGADPTEAPVEPTTTAPVDPTSAPGADPTEAPGADPTEAPVTEALGATPTIAPVDPTVAPGADPTEAPGADPTEASKKVKPEIIFEGRPTEFLKGGWPDGWIKRTYERMSGVTKGQTDDYWYSPREGKKLRSLTEVKRFLEALKECNDDEDEAYKQVKKKRK